MCYYKGLVSLCIPYSGICRKKDIYVSLFSYPMLNFINFHYNYKGLGMNVSLIWKQSTRPMIMGQI